MSARSALLFAPDIPFRAFSNVESDLRGQYLRLETAPNRTEDLEENGAAIIKNSARFLELALVGSYLAELLEESKLDIANLSSTQAERLVDRVREMYNLNPEAVLEEAKKIPGYGNRLDQKTARLSLPAVIRAVRSLLEACPIDDLEDLASRLRLEPTGHRCRVAFDGLKAFVFRNDPSHQAQLRVVAQAYAKGGLSASEVATLMNVHVVDAVALLEQCGYSRSVERISLDPESRREIYSRMRADRLARKGLPHYSSSDVARDVVASERIEGVDARRWIPREGL